MGFLIAESGSSKTDWLWVDGEKQVLLDSTIGLNPNHISWDSIREVINQQIVPKLLAHPDAVYFFGAGLSSVKNCENLKTVLQSIFTNANIDVAHDSVAAAKATLGNQEGLVAILGTGSVACYYDGSQIKQISGGLGYLLGDEGSGMYLGKCLVVAYCNGYLPKHLAQSLQDYTTYNHKDILQAIYQHVTPHLYLASLTHWVVNHVQEPEIQALLQQNFEAFYQQTLHDLYQKYAFQELSVVGSIGFLFQEVLRQVLAQKGIVLSKVIQKPLSALAEYYSKV